jgi:hypothetical protein
MAATTVIVYKRGDQYVENSVDKIDEKTKKKTTITAHGLVGELWVHGLCFDAIERMDDYVCLDGGKEYISGMYWHERLGCYVINPWHEKFVAGGRAEILVHKASVPSHLEGCVAPGFLDGKKLTLSGQSMEVIWEQCGGKSGVKKVTATLRVEGNMKRWQNCTAY